MRWYGILSSFFIHMSSFLSISICYNFFLGAVGFAAQMEREMSCAKMITQRGGGKKIGKFGTTHWSVNSHLVVVSVQLKHPGNGGLG